MSNYLFFYSYTNIDVLLLMSFYNSAIEPKFFIGEIVKWNNKINPRYVKIVTVYKVITESNVVFFRYGGLKEIDNKKSYLVIHSFGK